VGARTFVFPPPVPSGARVRVVATSGLVDPARVAAGLDFLRTAGFEPVYDESRLFAVHGYVAGSHAERLEELNAAVADPDAAVVWVARGGYGATRLLPGLDLAPLEERPKWLVGFSDVTALHAAWLRAGWGTLHGPNVSTLERWTDPARDTVLAWLAGAASRHLPGRMLRGRGPVSGPLVGGNLSVLTALVGTPYLPPLDGAVLLLEDLDEAPYRIDRLLTQLRQAGCLDSVAGFVLGQWTRCGDSYEDAAAAALDALDGLAAPVLGHVEVGHDPASFPVPLGATATIEGGPDGVGRLVVTR